MKQLEAWLIAISRAIVLVASAATALCASAIMAFQLGSGFAVGMWNSVPMSQILAIADINIERTYTTASANAQASQPLSIESVLGWVLDVPAMIPLFIALCLLVVFDRHLASVDNRDRRSDPSAEPE